MSKVEANCLRVLRASAPLLLSAGIVEGRPWASALFVGHRFTIAIVGDDALLEDWLIALPDIELTWPGHFIASAEVVERGTHTATIELLVVED